MISEQIFNTYRLHHSNIIDPSGVDRISVRGEDALARPKNTGNLKKSKFSRIKNSLKNHEKVQKIEKKIEEKHRQSKRILG